MPANITADQVKNLLGLEPNATCGSVRLSYVSDRQVAPGGLPPPFDTGRPIGSALYFMLTPEQPVKLHRIRNDQLYHYYLGDPIEGLLLLADGTARQHMVGPDLRAGHAVQLFIPGGTFHTARLAGEGRWFLGGSTEWPGVVPEDVEICDAETLAARFPAVAAQIRAWPEPARQTVSAPRKA